MGRIIKYLSFLLAGLVLVLAAALLVVPKLIDVEQYKPVIEEKISAATGRKVSLGGQVKLSLFPWVGVSLADFQVANPEGFSTDTFLRVNAFQAHVKVMPLLSKEIFVDKIVLDGPQVYLEKLKNGKANWEGFGATGDSAAGSEADSGAATQQPAGFAVKSIEVGEFALRDGKVVYADNSQESSIAITGISLLLQDVSLTKPLGVDFSASYEGKPMALQGQVGPLAAADGAIGKGAIPVDLTVRVADRLKTTVAGQLEDVLGAIRYSFEVNVEPFSPRELVRELGMETFPVQTADPKALDKLGLALKAAGTATGIAITEGRCNLDDSRITFEADLKSFSPLNLAAAGSLDQIDLDRYLPPAAAQGDAEAAGSGPAAPAPAKEPTDYSALRALKLDTKFSVESLKVRGGTVDNIAVRLKANNGVFTIDPFGADLYSGKVSAEAHVDVRKNTPVMKVTAQTAGIQVGPLLQDFADKDVLEGALASKINLSFRGETPEAIKKSLNGDGLLTFTDGAIVGIDLAGMVRNVQASFGMVEKPTEKPRTDFAELKAPFDINNGLVNTPGTTLSSPLVRVAAAGTAHLVTEKLNMKVQPKFVATLKGQGDTVERSGIMVPILIGGTFSKPTFAPDIAGLVKGGLPDANALKEALQQELNPDKENSEGQADSIEQGIRNLIPQFKF